MKASLLLGVISAGILVVSPAGRSAEGADCAWRTVSTPQPGVYSELWEIGGFADNDIWALGQYRTSDGEATVPLPLVEHWNGHEWRLVRGPNETMLPRGLAAFGTRDVWFALDSAAVHWDGKRWRVFPIRPQTDRDVPELTAIGGGASNDLWVAGEHFPSGALTVHWNGSRWSVASNPAEGSSVSASPGLASVVAVGRDVWAVGAISFTPLIMRWHGRPVWKRVPSPPPGRQIALTGVAGTSPTDVWTVGGPSGATHEGLIEHWDGRRWRIVAGARIGPPASWDLLAVSALSRTNAWAVGAVDPDPPSFTRQGLIEHWNGSHWKETLLPRIGPLVAVAAFSPTNVWAAGSDAHDQAAVVRYSCS